MSTGNSFATIDIISRLICDILTVVQQLGYESPGASVCYQEVVLGIGSPGIPACVLDVRPGGGGGCSISGTGRKVEEEDKKIRGEGIAANDVVLRGARLDMTILRSGRQEQVKLVEVAMKVERIVRNEFPSEKMNNDVFLGS